MTYQRKVEIKLYELKHQAMTLFKVDIGKFDVKYDLTTQNALGMVKYRKGGISMRLNRLLLEEDANLYIDEVVVHEVCHLIINARFPDGYNGYKKVQAHGTEFKAVCRAFGIEGKATTKAFMSSKVLAKVCKPKVKSKTHYYKCECAIPKEFSTRRHNQAVRYVQLNGFPRYACGTCNTPLHFIKTVQV